MTVEAACSLYVDGPWLGLLLYVDVSPSSELNGWANQYGCVGRRYGVPADVISVPADSASEIVKC